MVFPLLHRGQIVAPDSQSFERGRCCQRGVPESFHTPIRCTSCGIHLLDTHPRKTPCERYIPAGDVCLQAVYICENYAYERYCSLSRRDDRELPVGVLADRLP